MIFRVLSFPSSYRAVLFGEDTKICGVFVKIVSVSRFGTDLNSIYWEIDIIYLSLMRNGLIWQKRILVCHQDNASANRFAFARTEIPAKCLFELMPHSPYSPDMVS